MELQERSAIRRGIAASRKASGWGGTARNIPNADNSLQTADKPGRPRLLIQTIIERERDMLAILLLLAGLMPTGVVQGAPPHFALRDTQGIAHTEAEWNG